MTVDERRRQENADLIARMKRGESLSRIDPAATWWPPRPTVAKDQTAIRQLFEVDDDS